MKDMITTLAITCMVALVAFGGCGAEQKKAKADDTPPTTASTTSTADKLVVYYFHTNTRCWTCNQFEKLTKEVLEEEFAEQTDKGLLEYRVVNVEQPANEHFVDDYKLVTKSLVLSLRKGDEQLEWKNLDKIWHLVRDTDKYKSYVTEGIQAYLDRLG
jgi:hypothetical protein